MTVIKVINSTIKHPWGSVSAARPSLGGGAQCSPQDILLQEDSDLGRGETMECLICQDEDLKENPSVYREAVELYEERVTWSCLQDRVIGLAAAFWTN